MTAWAFSQSALTDDRIALADRKDAGIELGPDPARDGGAAVRCGRADPAPRRAPPAGRADPAADRDRARSRCAGRDAAGRARRARVHATAASAARSRTAGTTSRAPSSDAAERSRPPDPRPAACARSTGAGRSTSGEEHKLAGRRRRLVRAGAASLSASSRRAASTRTATCIQTLADLGLIGLAREPRWRSSPGLLAARPHARLRAAATPARAVDARAPGLAALALVAVVFGVHSAIDWTWFVPAVADHRALLCRLGGRPRPDRRPDAERRPRRRSRRARAPLPRGRCSPQRAALAAAGAGGRRRSPRSRSASRGAPSEKGNDALRLVAKGDFAGAHAAARAGQGPRPALGRALLRRAAVEDAARRQPCGRATARAGGPGRAREPGGMAAARRVLPRRASQPDARAAGSAGAIYLDPLSHADRNSYLLALRADRLSAPAWSSAGAASAAAAQAQRPRAARDLGPSAVSPSRARAAGSAWQRRPPAPSSCGCSKPNRSADRRASARV